MTWQESDHPRHPAGSDRGGEFRERWVGAVAAAIRSPEQDLHDFIVGSEIVPPSRELSGGSMASTRLETRRGADGTERQVVSKTYRSSPTSPMTVAREVVAAAIGRAMGVRVPTTIVDPNDPARFSVYLEYLPGESAYEYVVREHDGAYDALQHYPDTPEGRRIGLFDLLVSNTDRHAGNWMILPDGSIAGIDQTQVNLAGSGPDWHAGTFAIPYLRYNQDTGLFDLDEIHDLSPAEAAQIRRHLVALFERDDMLELLAVANDRQPHARNGRLFVDSLLARWDKIAAMARGVD